MYKNVIYNVVDKILFFKTLRNFQRKLTNFNTPNLVQLFGRNENIHTGEINNMSQQFSFNGYDIIGFDLDNTLLRYNIDEMVPMEYRRVAEFLVEKKGYSKEILKPIGDDLDFIQKGLVLDVDRGNILKLDCDGIIIKATHGTRFLDENEIELEYGPSRTWDLTQQYVNDPLSTWNGPLSQRMRALLDYFDMPAALVYARAVDALDAANQKRLEKYPVYGHVLEALIEMYARDNFAKQASTYFESLKAAPELYIRKTSPKVVEWLRELKKHKAIYLLTGSNIDFANLTATQSLGADWQNLFDAVICYARKPGFFVDKRPFFAVDGLQETNEVPSTKLKLNSTYNQGNWSTLKGLLSQKFNVSDPKCLYIGDNVIQDVYTPSRYCNMDTVCVCEEILGEQSELQYDYAPVIKSTRWGSYFAIADKQTLWASLAAKHAMLSVPTVEYLVQMPIQSQCLVDSGFHPVIPEALKSLRLLC